MGYLPNAIARGLATNRTYTLGVVVRDIADPFIAEMVRTIDKTALDNGYHVILSNCDTDPERELVAIQGLWQKRVDGIIVPDIVVGDSSLPLLKQIGAPIILVNRKNYQYAICTDNVTAAETGVNYLLSLGHKRVAYISGSQGRDDSLERQTGYQRALEQRGIEPDPSLIVKGDAPRGGWHALERLIKLPQPPTAIFCFDDLTAMGAIAAARSLGLKIPEDISIMGFDDINLAAYLVPALTTIAQQKEKMARLAVEMILKLLSGEKITPQTRLPAHLVVRDSTASPGQSA
jgi:DNA-binding LacI/PurR family transcriptional regulator